MSLHSRMAKSNDWDFISRISRESGYIDYIGRLGISYLDWGKVMVAEDDHILGFLKIEEMPDRSGWLSGMRVDINHRREGIGQYITEEVIKYARASGMESLRLLVQDENTASIALAEKCSFQRMMGLSFYEGSIDLSGFVESKISEPSTLFSVWKVFRYSTGNTLPGSYLTRGSDRVFVSSNKSNRFIHVLSGGHLEGVPGDGIVVTERSLETVSGLKRVEDFGTGLVYELKL